MKCSFPGVKNLSLTWAFATSFCLPLFALSAFYATSRRPHRFFATSPLALTCTCALLFNFTLGFAGFYHPMARLKTSARLICLHFPNIDDFVPSDNEVARNKLAPGSEVPDTPVMDLPAEQPHTFASGASGSMASESSSASGVEDATGEDVALGGAMGDGSDGEDEDIVIDNVVEGPIGEGDRAGSVEVGASEVADRDARADTTRRG